MNLFSKPAAVEPTVSGVDVLRQTVKARNRSPHALSLIAREVKGASASGLEDFASGKANLSVEILRALTTVLYPNAEYDPELNLLRALSVPARPLGCAPAPYDPAKHSAHYPPPAGPHANGTTTIAPVKPVPPTKPAGRPGWAPLSWE